MKKICMLSTGHSPVDDRIYHKEVKSLIKEDYSVMLIMPGDLSDYQFKDSKVQYMPLNNSSSLKSRFANIPLAIAKVLKYGPDICHFHDYELLLAVPFLRLFSSCKIIYDAHEAYPEMILGSNKVPALARPILSKIVNVVEKTISRFVHCVVVSDNNIAHSFNNANIMTETIFNYPKISMFKPDIERINELKNLYKDRTPIIYQGSMSAERGLFKMIEAMCQVSKKRKDVVLILVGDMDDDLSDAAGRMIKDNKIDRFVDIVGGVPHEDVVNYISISKVGLVPLQPTKKFMKNIPIKQFEYMACGIPVLGADLPPIASYINESGCGKVFNSTSSGDMAKETISMLEDESEWERMSKAGQIATREKWNWDEMERKLSEIYTRLS